MSAYNIFLIPHSSFLIYLRPLDKLLHRLDKLFYTPPIIISRGRFE